jgi:hypothetical protein
MSCARSLLGFLVCPLLVAAAAGNRFFFLYGIDTELKRKRSSFYRYAEKGRHGSGGMMCCEPLVESFAVTTGCALARLKGKVLFVFSSGISEVSSGSHSRTVNVLSQGKPYHEIALSNKLTNTFYAVDQRNHCIWQHDTTAGELQICLGLEWRDPVCCAVAMPWWPFTDCVRLDVRQGNCWNVWLSGSQEWSCEHVKIQSTSRHMCSV